MRPSQKGFLAAACAAFSGRPLPGLWGPVPGGRAGFVCLLLSSGCLSGPGVHRRIFILQGEYEAALTLYDAHVSAPVLPEFIGAHMGRLCYHLQLYLLCIIPAIQGPSVLRAPGPP